jgi:hypothetical protein
MYPICFVANDREFLFRHFAPAISAAKALSPEVVVYVPGNVCGAETQLDGVRIISSPTIRRYSSPIALIGEGLWFARALRKVDPAIVVAYSLRMCFVMALAHFFLLSSRFVFVVTGVGFFGIADSFRARMVRSIIFMAIRHVSRRRSYFLFENASDPVTTGIARRGYRFSILMGAGVDLHEFSQRDIPKGLPIRFATTSRLVWSKGIDLAVAAISTLARQGYPVELHIYGAPDFVNPRPVDPESFKNIPGVHYRGFSSRVADLWEDYHAAIFTSRGGEGLSRALLEAAASGPVGETGEANARADAAEGDHPVCTSAARKTGETAASERPSRDPLHAPGAAPLSSSREGLCRKAWTSWPGARARRARSDLLTPCPCRLVGPYGLLKYIACMKKLADFISLRRERFGDIDTNVFAFAWSKITRRLEFLAIIEARYLEASAAFVANSEAGQKLAKPGTHPVTVEQAALHKAALPIVADLHPQIESYYLFAKNHSR